jgi:hypothetical protein
MQFLVPLLAAIKQYEQVDNSGRSETTLMSKAPYSSQDGRIDFKCSEKYRFASDVIVRTHSGSYRQFAPEGLGETLCRYTRCVNSIRCPVTRLG